MPIGISLLKNRRTPTIVRLMQGEFEADPVLAAVEEFLRQSKMTPTAFGQRSLNDPTLVHEMRKGRECKRSTRAKIMGFIAAEKARVGEEPREAA